MPIRVQQFHTKGWRKPFNTTCVSRPSRFGNNVSRPKAKTPEAHAEAVEAFRRWAYAPEQASYRAEVQLELAGKNLACYCPLGWPCHADVLLELANTKEE
jgi:hypothetical protein